MAQWVKNLPAVAQASAEAQVRSLAQFSGLKDPAQVAAATRIQSLAQELLYARSTAIKKEKREFPWCHSRNESNGNYKVVGLIPGLAQWVKDPALL